MTPEEFDEAFDKWLKERFKPFRDSSGPTTTGATSRRTPRRRPSPRSSPSRRAPRARSSPSSPRTAPTARPTSCCSRPRTASVIRNLTSGFDSDYESLAFNSEFVAGRTIAFDPSGDTVAFFGRTGKGRSLFLVSALDGKVKKKVPMPLDEAQAPCLLPDGQQRPLRRAQGRRLRHLSPGPRDGRGTEPDAGRVRRQRTRRSRRTASSSSTSGASAATTSSTRSRSRTPRARPSSPSAPSTTRPRSSRPTGTKIYYSSNEDDDISNLRSLDLRTGAIQQYTDVFGGNMAPAPLQDRARRPPRLHHLLQGRVQALHARTPPSRSRRSTRRCRPPPRASSTSSPTCRTRWCPRTSGARSIFEGLYLEGRPPINVGVTSSGDFFGGTQIALTDVLGDQLFRSPCCRCPRYRIYDGRYTNLSRRLHYGVNFFDQTYFFYPYNSYYPGYYGQDPRDLAIATQRFTGGQVFAEYPLDTFRRLEFGVGVVEGRGAVRRPGGPGADLPGAGDPGPAVLHQQRLAGPDLAAPRPGDHPLRGVRAARRGAPSRSA